MKKTLLLNPGPVNTTPRVRQALLRGDLCHREAEFSRLMDGIRKKLLRAFALENEYTAVLVSGSGTAAMEMAVNSCLSPGRSLLVIQNGVYGERIAKMADVYGLAKHVVTYPWGTPPDMRDVETALQRHPEIEVVAVVHHETTTGLLNPIAGIGELARRYGKSCLVDCISSQAGDAIDFSGWNVDYSIGTANKCIQGFPGVSFVLVRKSELARLEKIPARSVYFNLFQNHRAQEKGDTLFTPAIQAHYALDEALDELLEETVPGRIARYATASRLLRDGFTGMGLEFMISREHLRSNTLTALKVPDGVTYPELHDGLKEQGYVIYAGQGNFNNAMFRVANMGDISLDEFRGFLDALRRMIPKAQR